VLLRRIRLQSSITSEGAIINQSENKHERTLSGFLTVNKISCTEALTLFDSLTQFGFCLQVSEAAEALYCCLSAPEET
jgi:hypothetical protein